VVTLDEINARINALTTTQVRDFVIEYAPKSMVLVTLGPQSLDAACIQSL
jgi:hypothetical protein